MPGSTGPQGPQGLPGSNGVSGDDSAPFHVWSGFYDGGSVVGAVIEANGDPGIQDITATGSASQARYPVLVDRVLTRFQVRIASQIDAGAAFTFTLFRHPADGAETPLFTTTVTGPATGLLPPEVGAQPLAAGDTYRLRVRREPGAEQASDLLYTAAAI